MAEVFIFLKFKTFQFMFTYSRNDLFQRIALTNEYLPVASTTTKV